jgi:hypothetical protein
MSRSGWVVLAGVFSVSSAAAAEVGLEIKAGPQQSWASVTGPFAFDTDGRTRFGAGVAAPIALGPSVSFDPELFYTEVHFVSRDFDPEASISTRALQLALPVRYHWSAGGSVSPHLAAGPQLALIGETRQAFDGTGQDISDDVRDLDVQLVAGAGLGIRAGGGRATLEARYVLGLRNLDETENVIKMRGLQLLVGYRF